MESTSGFHGGAVVWGYRGRIRPFSVSSVISVVNKNNQNVPFSPAAFRRARLVCPAKAGTPNGELLGPGPLTANYQG
jgi:hypothetical protein